MNLAEVCLAALVRELGADEVLRRVLGGERNLALAAPTKASTTRPAARQPKRSKPARRPAPAAPPAEPESEAARLVRAIDERFGVAAACTRFGFSGELLRRWRKGMPCSPRSLERLRTAAAAPVVGQEANPAGDEPAPQEAADDAA